MARDSFQGHTSGQLILHERQQPLHNLFRGLRRSGMTEKCAVHLCEHPGILIRLPPYHDTVDPCQMLPARLHAGNAPIDDDLEFRKVLFQPVDPVVVEGRYLTVFLGAESLQPGLACMDDKDGTARPGYRANKTTEFLITVPFIYTQTVLHRNRH